MPALRSFVRQGLQAEHYTVDVAEDGERARAMGSEIDYDLVILDLICRASMAWAVLRHLRLKRPTLPVLVLTLRSRVEDRVQCLDTGADDYLPKPFSFSELSARIRAPAAAQPFALGVRARSRRPEAGSRRKHRAERAGRRIELTSKEFSSAGIFNAQRRPASLPRP